MRYVFSLRLFKQMDAHTRARIHSLFLTLNRGKTMFSHDQILKFMGMYTMSLSRKYVFAVRCLQRH